MGSKGLGPLLPRDFLERQPKRWQKSQRKRGAVRALTKLASQRKKLEERAISDQRRVTSHVRASVHCSTYRA